MSWRAAWLGLLGPMLAAAGEPPAAPWRVRTDVQMVSLPMAAALRLATQLRRPAEFAVADATVQAMLLRGEADLLGWPVAEGQPDTPSFSSSVEEIRWPSEFDPPTELSTLSGPIVIPESNRGRVVPTSFEASSAGGSLRVDALVDGRTGWIDLSLVAEYVRLAEMAPIIGARFEWPAGRKIVQPQFIDWKVTTSLSIPNGGGALLGAFRLEQPQPRIVFFLLHAVARPHSASTP